MERRWWHARIELLNGQLHLSVSGSYEACAAAFEVAMKEWNQTWGKPRVTWECDGG